MHDDHALVSACQSGDITAFESLVHKYQDRIARMLYLLLGNADDAQDVCQETFIRSFRGIRAFRGGSSFSTWLHRIALNTAHNWIRSSKRDREFIVDDERWRGPSDRPDEMLLAKERSVQIRRALAELPPYYREAIILRHFDEMSYEEISELQNVPIGTVRSRLAKGRALLQRILTGEAAIFERTEDNGLQNSKETHTFGSR